MNVSLNVQQPNFLSICCRSPPFLQVSLVLTDESFYQYLAAELVVQTKRFFSSSFPLSLLFSSFCSLPFLLFFLLFHVPVAGFLVSKKSLLSFPLFCLRLLFFPSLFSPFQVSRGSVYIVYTQLLLGKIQCINLGCKSQLICSQIIKMRKLQYCH